MNLLPGEQSRAAQPCTATLLRNRQLRQRIQQNSVRELSKPAIIKSPVSVASRLCLVTEEKIQGGVWNRGRMAESRKRIKEVKDARWQTDVLVYAAIHYLDSPTDYREYLPYRVPSKIGKNREHPKKNTVPKNDFILLDDIPVYRLNWLSSLSLLAILLCIALLGIAAKLI